MVRRFCWAFTSRSSRSSSVDRINREVAAPGFLSDLLACADRQCGKLLPIEDRIAPHKALDLVNAAVVDTCDGVRTWHSEARSLRRHLEQTVKLASLARERASAAAAVHPGWPGRDRRLAGRRRGRDRDVGAREEPRTRPDALVAQREVRARVFDVLRGEAARDPELLALLDANETGHHIESDAEARVGVAGQAFKNLLRRFKTIRGHVPADLRGAAFDVMVCDGGAPLASVAPHRRHVDGVIADRDPANASNASTEALAWSGDSDDGGDGPESEAA